MTTTDLTALAARIEELFDLPTSDLGDDAAATVEQVMTMLDEGEIRVAAPTDTGWQVNEWAKKAILLSFRTRGMETIEVGPYEYHDKMPLKTGWAEKGVRVVPPATARQGAYIAPGVVLMPSYVNVGAWVGSGTMVDTWATVGSCAQIGTDVHLSGGVGIGGVLEPLQASPVIVEDGAFVGSRCVVVEGVPRRPRGGPRRERRHHRPRRRSSTSAATSRSSCAARCRRAPSSCPGTRKKKFPAGSYRVPCALIIGERSASTDRKTSLTEALREHAVSV